jgi:alpha-D-ribose 1-methylphosphonate 5-triphosphate synthase subunit PhnG
MNNALLEQSTYLSVLCRAEAAEVKALAEALIPTLEPISVLRNRTGLAMLPMEETAQGEAFYLGEVLIAEAHVQAAGAEGYAACLGRDLEQALAVALIDAAYSAGIARADIAAFVAGQAALQAEADAALLRDVERTRVDLETF